MQLDIWNFVALKKQMCLNNLNAPIVTYFFVQTRVLKLKCFKYNDEFNKKQSSQYSIIFLKKR